ncbi:MAG: hypothetical protein K8F25_05390 [Fimbriimonadaceae bacterium]|nr:hypothetical protein [Alphaproteobacteria bacterium]
MKLALFAAVLPAATKYKSSFLSKSGLLSGCALLVMASMGACTPKTDFDRPTQSVNGLPVNRNLDFYSAPDQNGPQSNFKYTQQEIEMRKLGYRLTVAHRRSGESYYRRLKNGPARTDYSMWTRLIDDIRADEVSALRFIPAMHRVLQTDYDRHRVFLARGQLDPEELQNLSARLSENRNYATLVQTALENRIAAYREAIVRAEVEVPSGQALEAKYAIEDLNQLSGEFERALDYDHAGASARVATRPVSHEVIPAPILDYSLRQ